jgi:hypothetical protein
MTKETKPAEKPTGLALLRAPFPENQISKLPKESRAQIDERKSDRTKVVWNCEVCGGTHHKNAVHLDYVGHAALTDRLLDCDPAWTWEPFAISADGLPLMDRTGGLWIKLTVCGVTRNGYGDADGKTGGNAVKEAIGDALRNAAMRFGAALDLWHKGDLHAEPEAEEADEPAKEAPAKPGTKANSRDLYDTLVKGLRKCRSSHQLRQWAEAFKDDIKKLPADWAAEIREEYKAELNAHLDHETVEEQADANQ